VRLAGGLPTPDRCVRQVVEHGKGITRTLAGASVSLLTFRTNEPLKRRPASTMQSEAGAQASGARWRSARNAGDPGRGV